MAACTRVGCFLPLYTTASANTEQGIGPKLLQSVLTAAFLFAFKDVLYDRIARTRMNRALKA